MGEGDGGGEDGQDATPTLQGDMGEGKTGGRAKKEDK